MPDETNDLPSLEALSQKIRHAQPEASKPSGDKPDSDVAMAFRFTADLLAGLLVGGLIGYGIDVWLGTLPWAMIVCIFLGIAAGIRNMMRTAKQEEKKGE